MLYSLFFYNAPLFKHQNKTKFPPSERPLMVWDGECGFCHYWIIRWKLITGSQIDYSTYQTAAVKFPDIPVDRFREAVRLIEPDGCISSGPAAAFRSFFISGKYKGFIKLYLRSGWFRKICDNFYQFMADNRGFFYNISKALFGKNPRNFKFYWLYYLLSLAFLIITLILT